MPATLRRLAGIGAGLCCVLVAVLSLLPADEMRRTGAGGHLEHLAAYAATACLCRLATCRMRTTTLALCLCGYAGVLELLQQLAPGRSSKVEDFAFSAAGVAIGLVVAAVAQRRLGPG
ncbi:MAG: VanZ family protein [Hyphomicrobiaceae bacterium]|nr:VanZ family protein [Hyphomicrobiaceae bacterium]